MYDIHSSVERIPFVILNEVKDLFFARFFADTQNDGVLLDVAW